MKEHPIIFNTEMVKAYQAGRKTMTRRVIKPQPRQIDNALDGTWEWKERGHYYDDLTLYSTLKDKCPHGQAGDRLWVKEIHRRDKDFPSRIGYSDEQTKTDINWGKWTSSRFMPKFASRIALGITEVRVERQLDITLEDAIKEGFGDIREFNEEFLRLYPHLKDTNPWVWVISFKKKVVK